MASVVDEFDTEMFIASVKKHPEIWNVHSEEYKDKRLRDTAWDEVSRDMVDNFDEREHKEKNEIIRRLGTKWRNLRDAYTKSEKKRSASEKPATKVRQYIYAKQLSFLQQPASLAVYPSTISEEEDDERSLSLHTPEGRTPEKIQKTSGLISRTSEPIQAVQLRTEIQKTNYKPYTSLSDQKQSASSVQHRKELENSLLKFMNQPISFEPSDEDQLFFDSLLPTVRKLNDDERLEFRAQVLNALRAIKQGSKLQRIPQPYPQPQYHFPPTSQNMDSYPHTQLSACPPNDSFHRKTPSQLSSSIGSDVSTSMSPTSQEEILP